LEVTEPVKNGVVFPETEATSIGESDDIFVVETSLAQRSLWFINEMDPGLPTYNVSAVVRIRGALVREALERALNAVVERHEILRTSFAWEASEPAQVIHPAIQVTIAVTDLTEAGIPAAVREEVRRPFDLTRPPLLRMRLLRVAADDHVAILMMHHIITDGWSSAVLFAELSACYEAFVLDHEPRLDPLPIQFADYAIWENETLRGKRLDELTGYWSKQLAGLSSARLLPVDRLPGPEPSFDGDIVTFAMPDDLLARVDGLAREHGATRFMVLLAAWQVLLARHCGQYDVAVACPVANRERPEIARLIGYFVNTLILRSDLTGDPTFGQLLDKVRAVTAGAFGHQQLPFGKVVEMVRPYRHAGLGTPLARVMFVLQTAPTQSWTSADLTMEQSRAHTGTSKFELMLTIEPAATGHIGVLEYSTELYERATIERLTARFGTLLRSALDDPQLTLSRLAMLTRDERSAILRGCRARLPVSYTEPVHRLVARRAAQTPEATAMTYGGRPVTYRELAQAADRIAGGLTGLGLPPETPVTVLLDDPAELIAGWLGVLAVGCAAVPANPADDSPLERKAGWADLSSCTVTSSKLRHLAPPGHVLAIDQLDARGPGSVPSDQTVAGTLAWIDPLSGHLHTHAGLLDGDGWRPSPRQTPMEFMAALASGTVAELADLTQYPTADPVSRQPRRPAAADIYVLDERLEPVPSGVPGELYLGGQGTGRGLRADPAATARLFVADPHALCPGSRLYRTGYIARLSEDGELGILGSTARRVSIQGVPVMPEQVEALLISHPDVADCAVTVRADGEQPELGAYVVAASGRDLGERELRRYLAVRLPDVMIPVRFKLIDGLSRMPSGTADLALLPVFDPPAAEVAEAVRTPIEQLVADMVAGLVGTDDVDMGSNFLELGGHSLKAVELVIWAREEFDVELPLRLVYEATLADLAEFVFDELARSDAAAGLS
jgi:non-ribosomal peptide synthetase component F/acyl carrier protein